MTNYMKDYISLTLNGDEECEDEERGEDAVGEGFVRESHLVNPNIYFWIYEVFLYIYIYDMVFSKELAC